MLHRIVAGMLFGALALAPSVGAAEGAGNFDFYVFALSWSPGFCDTGGAAKAPDQCAVGAGAGFVVHGLWPDNSAGPDPQNCQSGVAIPAAALKLTDGVYPDEGLARYEYLKHGTCAGLDPQAYFSAVKALRDGIVVPDALKAPQPALDDGAERTRAGLHRSQRQSGGRQHGDRLPQRRTRRGAHLRLQGSRPPSPIAPRCRATRVMPPRSPSPRSDEPTLIGAQR